MEETPQSSVAYWLTAVGAVAVGLAIGAAGIYIGETDDAPGASLIGIALAIFVIVLGLRNTAHKP